MDSPSGCGGPTNLPTAYDATMARRSTDQERVQGAQAVRLIEGAVQTPQASAVLPPGATISVRA